MPYLFLHRTSVVLVNLLVTVTTHGPCGQESASPPPPPPPTCQYSYFLQRRPIGLFSEISLLSEALPLQAGILHASQVPKGSHPHLREFGWVSLPVFNHIYHGTMQVGSIKPLAPWWRGSGFMASFIVVNTPSTFTPGLHSQGLDSRFHLSQNDSSRVPRALPTAAFSCHSVV